MHRVAELVVIGGLLAFAGLAIYLNLFLRHEDREEQERINRDQMY